MQIFSPEQKKRRKATTAQWRLRNPDKVKAQKALSYKRNMTEIKSRQLAYRIKNKERLRVYQENYRMNNPEKVKAGWIAQYAKNPEKHLTKIHKRRKMLTKPTRQQSTVILAWARSWRKKSSVSCYWCSKSLSPKLAHVDHIAPISKGGENTIGNMCISCPTCNLRKNAKSLSAWNSQIAQPVLL